MFKSTGLAVRDLRLRVSMTQEQFAHELGVTLSTVNRWENGHSKPSRLARATIARFASSRGIIIEVVGSDIPTAGRLPRTV